VIRQPRPPHQEPMDAGEVAFRQPVAMPVSSSAASAGPGAVDRDARITAIVRREHDFIWRLVRRLGVPEASVDDATQQVFVVAARRVEEILPGSERSFLFGAALRTASDYRRRAQAGERLAFQPTEEADPSPDPEELADRRQQRRMLDEILEAMPMELRTVLVLFEFEQMTKVEVAALLEVPVGTAVSRLRRAREEFKAAAKRRLARAKSSRGQSHE
jgi:RNA polymerase sigma-70 factor (ECF subfamily)